MSKVGDFLDHLEDVMKAKGVSKYKLAKLLGVDKNTIKDIFNRDSYPKLETVDEICDALGIGKGNLFSYDMPVDYGVTLVPGDADLLEIKHDLDQRQQEILLAYAEGLRDGKR
jgi:transcriptional regulator with XRE-family HTH domain